MSLDEASILLEEAQEAKAQATTEDSNRAVADRFKTWVHNYLTTEYPTIMNWIISNARFISKFRYGESLDAFVRWNGDTVTVRTVRTTLSQFSNMVWNEYENTSALLCQIAFIHQRRDLPSIPWDSLEDDPRNSVPGYSVFNPASQPLAFADGFVPRQLVSAIPQKEFKQVAISNLEDSRQVQRYCEKV